MIEFPFRHCILPRLGRSSSAENWSCLDLFCIMVSLCGDFILRSRALEAQVNTLLFASLHIHEGHRGIRYSFFFSFLFRSVVGITKCSCEFCLFFFLCDLLCIDTHPVSRHYRLLMRPLRKPKLGNPYLSLLFLFLPPPFSSLQHVDIASSAPLPTFSSLCMTV